MSRDGRYVVFMSAATNLVLGDTNGVNDVFVHDRRTRGTSRVSVSSGGFESSGSTQFGAGISGNGRYVTFAADDGELVVDDANGVRDVFVHDRRTGRTSRISVSSTGIPGDGLSNTGSISGDGRYVSFHSRAGNLVPGDTNGVVDVFVHDQWTGRTSRIDVSSTGSQANIDTHLHSVSENGRFVVFCSAASNLVPGDTNDLADVFVRDLRARPTVRVDLSGTGEQANGECHGYSPSLSRDGRYVAYFSDATNLVPGDTNGVGDAFVYDRHARWAWSRDRATTPARLETLGEPVVGLVPADLVGQLAAVGGGVDQE
jgi:Tol biopolymer transport system component